MSSTMMHVRPSMSPTTSVATATLCVPFGRRLSMNAMSALEPVGETPGELAAARVGRDDHRVAVDVVLQVLRDHRHRREVVDRVVEEALDLAGVQVDGDDAIRARRRSSMSATRRAVIGSRPSALRSWRAYP